jgi:hypothetical protein
VLIKKLRDAGLQQLYSALIAILGRDIPEYEGTNEAGSLSRTLDEHAADVVALLLQGPIQGRPKDTATLHQLAGALFQAAERACKLYMKHPLPKYAAYAPNPAYSAAKQVRQDMASDHHLATVNDFPSMLALP